MPLSTLSTERQDGGTTAAGVSLMEVSTFMTEQLKAVARMEARMDKQALEAKAEMEAQRLETRRQAAEAKAEMEAQRAESRRQAAEAKAEMEAQRAEAKAEMEAQRLENDKLRAEVAEASIRAKMQVKVDGAASVRLRDQQLIALQARLEALSAAKLLTDDELFAVEDVVGDSSVEASEDDQVAMLLALSARMASDSAFARQLRRKVVAQ
jgi:uncharacterized membrane protein YqiK